MILKSHVPINLLKIFSEKAETKHTELIYLIPGIYLNQLNKPYTSLQTERERNQFINPSVIRQIKHSTISYCNSSHTQEILQKYYNINTLFRGTYGNGVTFLSFRFV